VLGRCAIVRDGGRAAERRRPSMTKVEVLGTAGVGGGGAPPGKEEVGRHRGWRRWGAAWVGGGGRRRDWRRWGDALIEEGGAGFGAAAREEGGAGFGAAAREEGGAGTGAAAKEEGEAGFGDGRRGPSAIGKKVGAWGSSQPGTARA
jgi:hypothetical protein